MGFQPMQSDFHLQIAILTKLTHLKHSAISFIPGDPQIETDLTPQAASLDVRIFAFFEK